MEILCTTGIHSFAPFKLVNLPILPRCLLANHLFRKGTTTLSLCSPGITCVGTKVSDKRFTLHLAPKGHRNWVAALVGNSLQKPGLVELEICLFRGGGSRDRNLRDFHNQLRHGVSLLCRWLFGLVFCWQMFYILQIDDAIGKADNVWNS